MDNHCKIYQDGDSYSVEITQNGQGPFIYREFDTWDAAIEHARGEGFAIVEVRT